MLRKLFFLAPMQKFFKGLVLLLGVLGFLLCGFITVLVVVRGLPLFLQYGPAAVLLGTEWRPHSGQFGMLPLILSTLYSMLGALLLSVPFAVFSALFIHGLLPKPLRAICLNLMMVLARIPSVIYGLIGIVWLLPFLQTVFRLDTGFGLLAVILVLAAALSPQMLVLLLEALGRVPSQVVRVGRALGATEAEVWFSSLLPYIKMDILSAALSCAGRAVGETIVVAMVAGSISNMPGLFGSVSSLALEASGTFVGLDGETGKALFAVALVLMVLVALLALARRLLVRWGNGR